MAGICPSPFTPWASPTPEAAKLASKGRLGLSNGPAARVDRHYGDLDASVAVKLLCPIRELARRRDSDWLTSALLARAAAGRARMARMPTVEIKDLPEEVHAVLRRRAAAAHQSLQEYVRSRLIAEAGAPTVDEVLDRAGGRAGGSVPFSTAVRALRGERAGH